ncbi:MAG TPA: hypothetical protein VMR52_08770 [Dehalococcoidia bacterium]|nr:hypothetical protein [Dehalococcoidia bacterium]
MPAIARVSICAASSARSTLLLLLAATCLTLASGTQSKAAFVVVEA